MYSPSVRWRGAKQANVLYKNSAIWNVGLRDCSAPTYTDDQKSHQVIDKKENGTL